MEDDVAVSAITWCHSYGGTSSVEKLVTALQENFGPDIDDPAEYDPQTTLSATPQVGVLAFRDLILATFSDTGSFGINRPEERPGRSEHKEGRAWDWKVCRDRQGALAADLLTWLLSPDEFGNAFAAARRFGIMYIIWDSRIWGSYSANEGWRPYAGVDPHIDHVHFSFSWPGALGRTSWWQRSAIAGPA